MKIVSQKRKTLDKTQEHPYMTRWKGNDVRRKIWSTPVKDYHYKQYSKADTILGDKVDWHQHDQNRYSRAETVVVKWIQENCRLPSGIKISIYIKIYIYIYFVEYVNSLWLSDIYLNACINNSWTRQLTHFLSMRFQSVIFFFAARFQCIYFSVQNEFCRIQTNFLKQFWMRHQSDCVIHIKLGRNNK